ncbi:hypothetical protein DOS84_09345 [Flavobacterium aquariorum]|uniref:Uncharacterized protein n=1 Tax=Flavobacterium aquariorum TaxID=2217670 RepID=A0A2W7U8G9_9FLAO|nr:DUF6370 family protein [Flavobacterium aquariorum]PZX93609.1 hypothetical protein DOS84_09345 [Flavobacterium aquariorum]
MKNSFATILLFIALISSAQEKKELLKSQIAEVSCGECQFGLKGKGCDLAIRIDGKSYFADGTKIDDHGDAHAKDGFCEAIRKAKVTGKIENNRFKVTSFTLLPEQK